jgi:universal stress protein A
MRDIKRILVATDFSDCSLSALERASQLAQAFGASIDVLHVFHTPPLLAPEAVVGYAAAVSSMSIADLVRSEAEQGMREFVEKAEHKGLAISDQSSIYGEAASTILRVAKDKDYDLIALGTHGRTGLAHVLLGSVAERVLRRSDLPVLTVREQKHAEAA